METKMNKNTLKQINKEASSINRVILKLTTGFTSSNQVRLKAKKLLLESPNIDQICKYKTDTAITWSIYKKITGFKDQILELLTKNKGKISNKSLLISELEDYVSIKKPIAGSNRHTGRLDKLKSTE